MAVEVANLLVRISADTAEVEAGIRRAQAAVGGFAGFLREAAAHALGFAAAMVGLRTADAAFRAGAEAIVGFNAKLEQSRIAWTTMLRSAQVAEAFLFDLQKFAAKTPFSFKDVEDGARRLLAMGFAARDIKPVLTALGDAAAGLGLGSEGVFRLSLALGQIQAKGRVLGEELRQLTEAGVNINEVIAVMAEQTGRSADEIAAALRKGQVAADEFIKAFMEFSRRRFGGMMAEQAKTFSGAMETIRDSLMITASMAFKPLFDRISQLAYKIAEFVQSDQFLEWGARVAAVVDVVLTGLGMLAEGFSSALSSIASTVMTLGQTIWQALQFLNPFARHSPSLVESVAQGVDIILAKFSELSMIAEPLRAAGAAVMNLAAVAQAGLARVEAAVREAQATVLAGLGKDVPAAFFRAQDAINALAAQLSKLEAAIQGQEMVVAGLRSQLDAATAAVRAKENAIRALEREMRTYDAAVQAAEERVQTLRESVDQARSVVEGLRDAISAAQDRIRQLASTPIAGTKEYEKRLADLNQQINELQLRLIKLKLAKAPQKEIEELEKQLEELRLKAEETRLEEVVKFDPLRRQIKELTDTTQELPFEAIIRGIKEQQASIAELQAKLGPATAAWEQQKVALQGAEMALKAAQAARDEFRKRIEAERLELENLREVQNAIQEQYSAQQARLSELKSAYSAAQQQIDGFRRVLNDILQQAERLQELQQAGAKVPTPKVATGAPDLSDAQRSLEEWKKKFEEWRNEVSANVMPIIQSLRTAIGDLTVYALQPAQEAVWRLSDAWNNHKDQIASAFNTILNIVSPIVMEVVMFIVREFGKVITWFQANWPLMQRTAETVMNFIWNIVSFILSQIAAFWQAHGDRIISIVNSVWNIIKIIFDWGLTTLLRLITLIMQIITGDWEGAWNTVKSIFSTTLDSIIAIGQNLLNILSNIFSIAWDGIKDGASKGWKAISDAITGIWDGIVRSIKGAINTIIDFINRMIRAWNSLGFHIPGFSVTLPSVWVPGIGRVGGGTLSWEGLNVSPIKLPEIPALALGGIVTRPTLAMLGEAGPEAVVPLSRGVSLAPITVNVYVAGSVVAERDLAMRVREELLRLGRRNLSVGLA